MELSAVVTKADLTALALELAPLQIRISDLPRRSIEVDRPPRVALVPGRGVRLEGEARVVWELPFSVAVRAWKLLLVPAIEKRADVRVLALHPILEAIDLQRLPGFLDVRIAGAINAAFVAQRDRLAWGFVRALSGSFLLPARVAPRSRFELVVERGDLSITDDAVRLTVSFLAHREPGGPTVTTPPSVRGRERAAGPLEPRR